VARVFLEIGNESYTRIFQATEERNTEMLNLRTLPETESFQCESCESNCLIDMELPTRTDGSFKSFMGYCAISYRNSIQWELQQDAVTDEEGFRRFGEFFMVALGTFYSPQAGMIFEIEFSSGRTILAITGDVKAVNHTDERNQYTVSNGCMVEFIVDPRVISQTSRRMGNMGFSGMEGSVVRISRVLECRAEVLNEEEMDSVFS